MEFIYAYMPLSDLADYNGDFFLENTRLALSTRVEKQWGSDIPADIFLHFVLPQRVNNENLDSFRIKYYDEISERIATVTSIEDAALEINHWCHEKVIYQPSDSRTSSPVYTILSARGRCGEESTFTVAALRCAGIPARQVYTPRWAHSDDNHAWVEVWVNGTWKYMGACEPEPVLDRGWFTEPARRAMLIHTKTFGAYTGNEPTTYKKKLYAEINNLSKYTVTKELTVAVVDEEGNIPSDAVVEFQLYNYAEFYPIATIPADENGCATLETGLGDLIVWARSGDLFDFRFVTVADQDTVNLVLNDGSAVEGRYEFDITAPLARTPFPGIPEDMVRSNNIRLAREDSIRQVYIDGWISDDQVKAFAAEKGYDYESIAPFVKKSMGNYSQIVDFLAGSAGNGARALDLLSVVAEKDLRDVPSAILSGHLENAIEFDNGEYGDQIFIPYMLNPRIANEIITSWRPEIRAHLSDKSARFRSNPSLVGEWIEEKP
ncbi:MAG: transglutaminase-like domain-containing protein [Bacteroidales bacterium]